MAVSYLYMISQMKQYTMKYTKQTSKTSESDFMCNHFKTLEHGEHSRYSIISTGTIELNTTLFKGSVNINVDF